MKCSAARHWLCTAEASETFPEPVRRHLDRCPRCRRRTALLRALEKVAAAEPAFPPVPAMRARLHNALAEAISALRKGTAGKKKGPKS